MEARTVDILKNLEKYEKRVGRSFLSDWNLKDFPNIYLAPNGMFFTWAVRTDCIEIGPSVFDLKQGLELVTLWCRAIGKRYIRSLTMRNPKAYARFVKGTIKYEAYDDDLHIWCIEKEVQ